MTADTAFQEAVRDAVLEVTGGEDVLRVTHTQAGIGWGRVLFVDVYTRAGTGSHEEFDPQLRKAVSEVAAHPFQRVAIRWRMSA